MTIAFVAERSPVNANARHPLVAKAAAVLVPSARRKESSAQRPAHRSDLRPGPPPQPPLSPSRTNHSLGRASLLTQSGAPTPRDQLDALVFRDLGRDCPRPPPRWQRPANRHATSPPTLETCLTARSVGKKRGRRRAPPLEPRLRLHRGHEPSDGCARAACRHDCDDVVPVPHRPQAAELEVHEPPRHGRRRYRVCRPRA